MTSRDFVLKMAKGFRGRGKNCFSIAKQRVERAMLNAYRSRRLKKRDMRALWIQQLSSATRGYGLNYSRLQRGLVIENIVLDRKVLASLASYEPYSFAAVATIAKTAWLRECGPYHSQTIAQAISDASNHQTQTSSSRIIMEENA